jgi:hypothetical protein
MVSQYLNPHRSHPMKLVRIVVLGLAVFLPTSWTIAHAADEAPAGETKTTTKTKKKKKTDGTGDETKTETKTEKKAE